MSGFFEAVKESTLTRPSSCPYCYRLGLEGLVLFKRETKFDAENYTISVPGAQGKDVTIAVFDAVTVRIAVEKDRNTQRGEVKMTLVSPVDSSGL